MPIRHNMGGANQKHCQASGAGRPAHLPGYSQQDRIGMRGVLVGYIALVLQHVIFGMRNAYGFVTRSVATKARRSHINRSAAGHFPATNESGRQESAAYCLQRSPWALLSCPCNEEEVAAAKEVDSGARASTPATATRGILTPLKERVTEMGEGDEISDSLLLYFAFGANMSPSVLTNKRGVKPLRSFHAEATAFATTSSAKYGTGAAEGLCMCFCHRAGYATLAPKPGPPQSWEASPGTHGVVHAISASDLKTIAASENGYRQRMVEVETPSGERDIAVCFVSDPSQTLPTSVPPTSRYLALLQDGATYHGVNERYSRWLEKLPSVPSEQEATSPERINTPSKTATDAVVTTILVVALGTAVVALGAV